MRLRRGETNKATKRESTLPSSGDGDIESEGKSESASESGKPEHELVFERNLVFFAAQQIEEKGDGKELGSASQEKEKERAEEKGNVPLLLERHDGHAKVHKHHGLADGRQDLLSVRKREDKPTERSPRTFPE